MARKPYVTKKQLNRAMYLIGQHGVRGFDLKELKRIGLPIIREVRKRVRELEKEGLTDSPAYRAYIIDKNMKSTTAGDDINKVKHEIYEASEFLKAPTSTVEGTIKYNKWLDEHLGAETTKEQRENIWDLVRRFEKTHPERFINYGYDETIKRISKAAEMADFDIEKAYGIFADYLKGQGQLADFERMDGAELDKDGVSPWFRGRNSMKDF